MAPTTPLTPPRDFRGRWLAGDDAARLASRVSGPFRALPAAYTEPADTADLRLLLRFARDHGLPVVPRGGGTGMPGGNLGPGIVVSLAEGFDEVGEVREDRIRVGAGTLAGDVEAAAAREGYFFPPLPSSAAWCTVGGMAANNAAGARSFRFGAIASWVEGVEGIDAAGETFAFGACAPGGDARGLEAVASLPERPALRALLPEASAASRPAMWPTVRKNSSGYALDRFLPSSDPIQLLVGSEGTLGVITGVALRLAPLPAQRGVVVVPADSPDDLARIAGEADRIGAWCCEFLGERFLRMARLEEDPLVGHLARDAYALVLLEIVGTDEEVAYGVAGARGFAPGSVASVDPEVANRLWSLRHAASPLIARAADRGRISTQFIEDCVVPPARLAEYLTGLDRILDDAGIDAVVFGHAGDANVHVNPLLDMADPDWRSRTRMVLGEVVELVASLGGTLAGEHGDGRLRTPFVPKIWGPEITRAFEEVKEALDPAGTLNPGVVVPTLGQDPFAGFHPRPRSWPT